MITFLIVIAIVVVDLFAIIIEYANTVLLVSAAISKLNSHINIAAVAAVDVKKPMVISSNNSELKFDTKYMTHRSAEAEWQPHQGQTEISHEWWYFTALLHDASGNRYLLFNTLFKFDGKDLSIAKIVPQLGPNTTIILPAVELSNYNTGFHYYNSDIAIVNPKVIWNSKTNTLSYKTPHYSDS